jgi:hypothetical protein
VRWWGRRIAGGIVLFAVAGLALSGVTMWLWNALVPVLFKGPSVTFLQAAGLLLLSHILLRSGGGFGPRGWRRERWRRFDERWQSLSPEERERMKAEWRKRCGWEPTAPGPSPAP